MKKALLPFGFILMFFSQSLVASHFSHGYITYQFMGNQAGYDSLTYEVEVGLYRNITGAAGATSLSLGIHLPYSSYYETLTYISPNPNEEHPLDSYGFDISSDVNCINSISPYSLYIYRGIVTFSSHNQYTLSPDIPCCRDAKDNLVNQGDYLGIFAVIKTNTYNSLPKPDPESLFSLTCVNNDFKMISFGSDPDNGFHEFYPDNAKEFQNGSAAAINWDTGFSHLQPIPIDSTGYYHIDTATGQVSASATQQGVFAAPILLNDYKYNSATGSYELAGSMHFETAISIHASCDTALIRGPKPRFVENKNTLEDSCGVSEFIIEFDQKIDTLSLGKNGQEFSAQSIDGSWIPIPLTTVLSDTSVNLTLALPINSNDTILIYFNEGPDSNTFLNNCGFEYLGDDTLTLIVQGCSGASLLENHKKKLSIYPNPSSGLVNLKGADQYPISSILVLNPNGKVLKELNYQKGKALKLDEFKSGLYILKLGFDDGTMESHSLIVK